MSHLLHHIHTHTPNPQFLLRISPNPNSKSKSKTLSIRSSSDPPARDRVIDFGKYKGKMLGALPSTYLKWVSSNLRARDFEVWAKLADQVLADPVYQDRLEWEFAQRVLNGDVLTSPLSPSSSSAVSSLVEISERFGWDNEDKIGWSKLNFDLLGTSNGGRIPRIGKGKALDVKEAEEESFVEADVRERRGERRERAKLRRSTKSAMPTTSGTTQRLKQGKINGDGDGERRIYDPFPGREGLLRKVMDARGKRPAF